MCWYCLWQGIGYDDDDDDDDNDDNDDIESDRIAKQFCENKTRGGLRLTSIAKYIFLLQGMI